MISAIPVAIFSSAHLLRQYAYGEHKDIVPKRLERQAFIDSWARRSHQPDFVHKNLQDSVFGEVNCFSSLICRGLDYIAEACLELNGDTLTVRENNFELWQETITEISPIVLMSWKISKDEPISGRSVEEHARALIARNIRAHIFPGYHSPLMEESLRKVGLCDLHVHLNGSTPSDVIWQDALALPRLFRAKLNEEWRGHKEEVDELFHQLSPYFDRRNLASLVDIASNLRDWLVRRLFTGKDCPLGIDSLTRNLECRKSFNAQRPKGATCEYFPCYAGSKDSCSLQEHKCVGRASCGWFNWWKRILMDQPLDRFTLHWPPPPMQHRMHALQKHFPTLVKWCAGDTLQQEAYFLANIFKYLRENQDSYFAQCVHYYFLIQGLFTRMLVQQVNQYGFDQFQKITLSGIREYTEARYIDRLRQFAEGSDGIQTHVEARFAPKEGVAKLRKLLSTIGSDYGKFRYGLNDRAGEKRLELSLVAHFIKQPDRKCFSGCQFYMLRRSLVKQARHLVRFDRSEFHRGLFAGFPALSDLAVKEGSLGTIPFGLRDFLHKSRPKQVKGLLSGFDAAANELHTPPEVFAPVFRMLRRNGMSNFCFHVGEDFRHLISGIRAVDEAVTFLELSSGSRIGHATALGIDPGLWLRKAGPKLPILRSEWLDTLVYAYQALHQIPEFNDHAGKALDAIHEHSQRVYGRSYLPQELWQAWKLRRLDPIRALVDKGKTYCHDLGDRIEWKYIEDCRKNAKEAYKLFEKYHSKKLFGQFNPRAVTNPEEKKSLYIEVETDFFDIQVMIQLQKMMLKKLNEKCIAIETLISSNVRISCYETYDDHHILRWLGLLDRFKDEPRPTVCLGTDDPGIFATSIKNECLHLFRMLRNNGRPQSEAVQIIEQLITNSKAYLFRRR